jgi:hypothetical protein
MGSESSLSDHVLLPEDEGLVDEGLVGQQRVEDGALESPELLEKRVHYYNR